MDWRPSNGLEVDDEDLDGLRMEAPPAGRLLEGEREFTWCEMVHFGEGECPSIYKAKKVGGGSKLVGRPTSVMPSNGPKAMLGVRRPWELGI
ncbi:hypothetical protein U9M48_035909 [Paspalum notatum var. saurae]|uniref:Uncharacterized protein n=1 Tax=Paspalum notatum var. saurae TaxID=547442 RepID=A0AAQ3UD31_PASNO